VHSDGASVVTSYDQIAGRWVLTLDGGLRQARLVQEKSMIGRLQRELVTLNRARMDWEDTLLASGRGLVRKQAEVHARHHHRAAPAPLA
jgi:hypothetical protein